MRSEGNRSGRWAMLGLGLAVAIGSAGWLEAQSQNGVELNKQIELYRAASLHASPPEMSAVQGGRIWTRLAMLYEEAGMYAQSEMAFVHALQLLEMPPVEQLDLARAIDELGTLYMVRGDLKQAERAELHASAIREAQKLKADLPRSWFHLAVLALREHRAEKASEYAERAVTQLRVEPDAHADDRMNVLFVLAMAQCRLRRYPQAIATLQEAMVVVRSSYGPEDFPTGFVTFLLGHAYWKSGDIAAAVAPMQVGAELIKNDLGWEHPACLSVMTQYEQFLRSTHKKKEARALVEELKQARETPRSGRGPETVSVLALF